jgi:ABC-type glutathione transport system ATPase component
MNAAVMVAIAVAAVGFEAFCLVDLYRARDVRHLPKWAWAAICIASLPLGGIAYLSVGRVPPPAAVLDDHTSAFGPLARRSPSPSPREKSPSGIEVERLTKQFGSVRALDDLNFVVRPGHVTGFLGPNGAGKSTTMRMILGLDAPTAGHALVGGRPYQEIVRPLHQVGSLLDANALHPGRSAWQHLQSVARSNGIGARRVTEVLQLTGVDMVARQPVRTFRSA